MSHRGLDTAPSINGNTESLSALSGADFYLPVDQQLHQIPIQFKNGLVDPTPLLEYLGECYCGKVCTHVHRDHIEEHHHLYFPLKRFKNNVTPLRIRQLRNSRYNQFLMLSCQEDTYHQSVQTEVPLEYIELDAASEFMEADVSLTKFAAVSWLISDIEAAKSEARLLTKGARAKLEARQELLTEIQQEQRPKVESIEIIAPSVVRGALTKYLARRPEKGLQDFLAGYHKDDQTILFTKIHKEHGLKNLAEVQLEQKIKLQRWIVQKALEPSVVTA